MKSTGILRKIDELGRVVLPMELRKSLNLKVKDSLDIYVEGDTIMLRKYEPSCIFCGGEGNITSFKGKNICEACRKQIAK